jgi:hypothetical protein
MVVFSVDVVRNCTTDRDEFCSESDRNKKTLWYKQMKNLGQRNPRFASHGTGCGVEPDESVQSGGREKRAIVVQTTVAVTTPLAVREKRRRAGVKIDSVAAPLNRKNVLPRLNGSSP